jgi:lipopolysaccharide/colanic/teichoic acid biosynthesis glycosyltransferase
MELKTFQPGAFLFQGEIEYRRLPAPIGRWTLKFVTFKFLLDKTFALAAMPVIALLGLSLLALNPFFNPGPLFYVQDRMGMGGVRFRMIKFRSMTPTEGVLRAAHERLEEERITPLGHFLRRTRIDELPNLINVLAGEMSVVGPRPDAFAHAIAYIATVPYYRDRFRVRPGVTGLAQVCGGYADTERAIARKARLDRFYVRKSRALLDLYIIWRTGVVMLTGFGAR